MRIKQLKTKSGYTYQHEDGTIARRSQRDYSTAWVYRTAEGGYFKWRKNTSSKEPTIHVTFGKKPDRSLIYYTAELVRIEKDAALTGGI